HHFGRTRDDDLLALGVGHVAHVAGKADRAARLGFDAAGSRRPGGRTTDVEGTHGQLGTRLANRLRGDDAHRLAGVYHRAAAEVTAIALGAQAVARLARERRTHLDLVDAQTLDQVDRILVEQAACFDHRL